MYLQPSHQPVVYQPPRLLEAPQHIVAPAPQYFFVEVPREDSSQMQQLLPQPQYYLVPPSAFGVAELEPEEPVEYIIAAPPT
jgi:hypothetical protein